MNRPAFSPIESAEGLHLGRPRTDDEFTRARIIELRTMADGTGGPIPWRTIAARPPRRDEQRGTVVDGSPPGAVHRSLRA